MIRVCKYCKKKYITNLIEILFMDAKEKCAICQRAKTMKKHEEFFKREAEFMEKAHEHMKYIK